MRRAVNLVSGGKNSKNRSTRLLVLAGVIAVCALIEGVREQVSEALQFDQPVVAENIDNVPKPEPKVHPKTLKAAPKDRQVRLQRKFSLPFPPRILDAQPLPQQDIGLELDDIKDSLSVAAKLKWDVLQSVCDSFFEQNICNLTPHNNSFAELSFLYQSFYQDLQQIGIEGPKASSVMESVCGSVTDIANHAQYLSGSILQDGSRSTYEKIELLNVMRGALQGLGINVSDFYDWRLAESLGITLDINGAFVLNSDYSQSGRDYDYERLDFAAGFLNELRRVECLGTPHWAGELNGLAATFDQFDADDLGLTPDEWQKFLDMLNPDIVMYAEKLYELFTQEYDIYLEELYNPEQNGFYVIALKIRVSDHLKTLIRFLLVNDLDPAEFGLEWEELQALDNALTVSTTEKAAYMRLNSALAMVD